MGSLIIAVIFSLVLAGLLIAGSTMTYGAAFSLIALPVFMLRPDIYFSLFLVTRPLFDLASTYKLAGPLNLAGLATLLLIVLCGSRLMTRENRRQIRAHRFLNAFNKIFILFLLISGASLLTTKDRTTTLSDFLRLVSVPLAFNYAVVVYQKNHGARGVLKLILLSSVVPLAFGLYQFIFKAGVEELGFNRVYGTFVHPNVFAEYLLLIVFVLIYVCMQERLSFGKRIGLYILAASALLCLVSTFTRGVWIAMIFSLFLFIMIKTPAKLKIRWLMVAAMVALLSLPLVLKRFSGVPQNAHEVDSWEWRLRQWTTSVTALGEHPFIGNGMGMYEKQFDVMAHNDYIRIAYETGFPGLLVYIALLSYVALVCIRQIRASTDFPQVNRYKMALSIVVSLAVMSVADNLARSTVIIIYFFVAIVCFLSYTTTQPAPVATKGEPGGRPQRRNKKGNGLEDTVRQ